LPQENFILGGFNKWNLSPKYFDYVKELILSWHSLRSNITFDWNVDNSKTLEKLTRFDEDYFVY
jgi:hypothetical protein